MTELLDKINMVATYDLKADPDPESDIKVSRAGTDSYLVDILVHFVITNENEDDKMDVHFAASKSLINNANQNNQDKACHFLSQICEKTLKTIELPGGVEQRSDIQVSLYERAERELVAFLNKNNTAAKDKNQVNLDDSKSIDVAVEKT